MTGGRSSPAFGGSCKAAFAHRRKTLANSLALAGVAGRERSVEALAELGRPAGARAQELEPGELLRLAELLA